ncbi:MAG: MurR/RpiR family transcriptional regulator [Acetanaerobacterium sp.]
MSGQSYLSDQTYRDIRAKMAQMSVSQVKIAEYILENPNRIPFLTVKKLSRLAGVSEATIVRFANFLGYSGFTAFQQAVQASAQKQLTAPERLNISNVVYNKWEKGVYDIFEDDINNLKQTIEQLDMDQFRAAVQHITGARKVFVAANQSASSLGMFLSYYLNILLGDCVLLSSASVMSDKLVDAGKGDVVLGISFSRYSRATVDAMRYAKGRGATAIAITDGLLSPLCDCSDVILFAQSKLPSFIDSFVAPLSLINALIIYIGLTFKDKTANRMNDWEQLSESFDVFYK